jgi:Peptidase of plants and bacteria
MTTPLSIPAILLAAISIAAAEVKTDFKHLDNDSAAPGFKFQGVPAPLRGDAGAKATFSIVEGERDPSGGSLAKLNDGSLPSRSDLPSSNFFFRAGTDGGRIVADFGSAIDLKQINTYSWHTGTRAPQVYRLYVSDGKTADFNAQPTRPLDPVSAGWKLLANVDTRPKDGAPGGQYGVSVTDSSGTLGSVRYVLFDINRTEDTDNFGNTFFSEIDFLDKNAAEAVEAPLVETQLVDAVEIEGGPYRFTVDTTEAPDLTEWSRKELIPVMKKWYPQIVAMLPSDGFTAPRTFSITFTESYRGVAATGGNRIECSPAWYRQNLKTEAIGSLVHELVHVAQQYGRARRAGGSRPPGWLVEGIPDYIRWYLYEPESRGAEIKPSNAARARHDGSYRVSANFINWVVNKYDKDLIKELNTVLRDGRYSPEIWKERTGKPLEELAAEWKKNLEAPATAAN